jgi:hypothetical protein
MRFAERSRQRAAVQRRGHPMNVVRQQAIAEHRHAMLPAFGAQCLEINPPVFVKQEGVLTVVAPLGDGMRNALRHRQRWAGYRV